MFIAGRVNTVFSPVGATSGLRHHAASPELAGFSGAIAINIVLLRSAKTCVETHGVRSQASSFLGVVTNDMNNSLVFDVNA
jgi:hypothetical protein